MSLRELTPAELVMYTSMVRKMNQEQLTQEFQLVSRIIDTEPSYATDFAMFHTCNTAFNRLVSKEAWRTMVNQVSTSAAALDKLSLVLRESKP